MGYAERNGKFPDGKPKWRARWQLDERNEKGRRREGSLDGFRRQKDAEKYAADQEAAIRAGTYVDPNAGKIWLGDYFELWLPLQKVKPSTRLTYRQYFNREIKPRWGSTPLNEIKTMPLMQWLASLNDPASPRRLSRSAINLVETVLNGMFALAVYEERIRKCPIPPAAAGGRTSAEYKPVREGEIFTRDEFAALLANLPTWQDVVFVITMLFTGTRWSETTAMRRGDLSLHLPARAGDQITGTFLMHPRLGALTKGEDYSLDFASPKSGGGRLLDLPPFHVLLLADWLGRIPAERERLFAAPMGGVLRGSDYNERVWRPCCDGREPYTTPHGRNRYPALAPAAPGKVPHDLKHTNKALMSDRRVNEIMQNYALGHKEAGSSGPYKHPTPQMRQERVDALQDAWEQWAIDLTALPAWSGRGAPGGRREVPAAREPSEGAALASTPRSLQASQATLF